MEISAPNFASEEASPDLIDQLFKTPVERHVLENGLTLVHRPDFSSEVVSVQVWVKTGSIHEGSLMGSGLSHYLEHLLFKGTARRDGKAISREVHAMGGGINAYTTFDRTVYYIDGPATAFEGAIDILADMALHSTLPEAEVERERDVILREIDMGLDDPDRKLSQALFRTAFQKHPYREPVIGHRELYEQVTREELFGYYKARYVPNNMVVSVVGAVSRESCLELVKEHFAAVARGRLAPVLLEDEPVQLACRRESIKGDFNVLRGGLAFKVPSLSHRDSPQLDALAYALGGGESSLFWERLRNQQNLVHYIDCRNWNPGTSGLLMISYLCDVGRASEVEAAIWEIIHEVIQDGLPETVVDKARRQSISAEINGRKTMSGQASRLGIGEVVIGDINYTRQYLKRLQAVAVQDLQVVARKYLVESGLSVVTIGPDPETASDGAGDSNALAPQAFDQVELNGSVRLLLQEDARLPKVHLRVVMLGGGLYEPEGQRGSSALLAELLTMDTATRSAAEIAELIESIGGKMTSSGGNNTMSLSIEVLPGDLDVAIELLADALLRPSFVAETFQTELEAQIAGLKEENDDILEYGFRKLRERFFGAHPLAVGSEGRIEDLEHFTVEALKEHYERLVTAPNVVLSVCGAFDRASVQERLDQAIASQLPQRAFSKHELAAPAAPEAIEVVEHMDREQAVVLQAFPDVGILDEDFVAGEMLNELFSGMSSRLFERVRDDLGLAYYVGSTRVLGLDTSMFVLYAGTHPDQVDEVIKEMNGELARVAAGDVLDDELARCRTRLKAARPIGRQTIGARAMHAAINLTYGLPLDDDAEHAAKLDACDAANLAAFAQRFLSPEHRVQLVVRPE